MFDHQYRSNKQSKHKQIDQIDQTPNLKMSTDEETGGPVAATLQPLFTYGVKPDVHGGVHFTRSDTLLYPSGCGISLYSTKDKKQELVPLADKGKHLTAIGVNKNR